MPSENVTPSNRKANGKWNSGVSGNPSGRPAGSRNKSTLLLEQLLQSRQEELIEKTIDLALQGEPTALRLCIERLLPVLRERRVELALPEVRDMAQATAAVSTILTGIGEGQITPGEGEVLTGIVETQKRLIEAQQAEQYRKTVERQNTQMEAEIQDQLRSLCRTDQTSPVETPNDIPS